MKISAAIKKPDVIVFLLTLFITVAGYLIGIQPVLARLNETTQKYHALVTQQKQLNTQKQLLDQINRLLLNKYVTSTDLIKQITRIGEKSRIATLAIKPLLRKSVGDIVVDRFQISGRGSFESVVSFYQQLSQCPYFFLFSTWKWTEAGPQEIKIADIIEVYHH